MSSTHEAFAYAWVVGGMRSKVGVCVRAGSGGCEERKENCIPSPDFSVPETQYNKYIFALCLSDSQYEVREANNSVATLSDHVVERSGAPWRLSNSFKRVIPSLYSPSLCLTISKQKTLQRQFISLTVAIYG